MGVAALQFAKARGIRTVGTAGSPEGLALVRRLGADLAVAHDDAQAAPAATGGRGFDLVLDIAAHLGLVQDIELLAPGGRIAVIGARAPVEVHPRGLMSTGGSVHGILVFLAPPAELHRINLEIVAGLAAGTLAPVVGRSFPLQAAPAAHHALMTERAAGKVTLSID